MVGHYREEIFKVIIDIDVIGQSGLNKAVSDGTGFCSVNGVDVHPVLPSEGERTYCPFSGLF